jgi:hypothetical protein
MTGGTALRLALSQVGRGEATYYFRSGQIVVTSAKRTLSPHFLESTSVEAKFTNRPLTAALDELAEQSGVSILIDCREWAKAQKPVSARFQEAKLRTAVQLLSDTAGLKAVVVDNVIYVTSPENVAQFKEKTVLRLGHSMTCFGAKDRLLTNAVEDFTSNWVMDGRVKNKTNIRVTAKWLNNIESDTALRLLTDMAGLRHVVIDDVTYITSPANAKKLEEEQARKKPSPD